LKPVIIFIYNQCFSLSFGLPCPIQVWSKRKQESYVV